MIIFLIFLTLVFYLFAQVTSYKLYAALSILLSKFYIYGCYGIFFFTLSKTLSLNQSIYSNDMYLNKPKVVNPTVIMAKLIWGFGALAMIVVFTDFFLRIFLDNYCKNSYILVFTMGYSMITMIFCLIGI